jgi:PAS domain S-box-containing protein
MTARRQKLYRELQTSESYLAEAQQLSHTGSFGWNASTGEIHWSAETFRIFEFEPTAKLTIESILDRTHREDRTALQQIIQQASRDRTPFQVEHRLQMPDGTVKYLRVVGRPSLDEGQCHEFVGAVTDITDRKRAEEALAASERNLATIINTIPTAAWRTQPDGSCDFLNQRWLDYAGMTAEQAQGWGWAAAIHPDDLKGLMGYWQSSLASGTPVEAEARMRRFDGVYRWFLFRANPWRDESGKVVKWYGTNIDIEDRKLREEALRANSRGAK